MKVFISWSGDLSKKVAEVLHDWIEDVLQGTDAWISTDDIDKGSLWFSDIANGLSETGVGILVLSKDNVSAPWLLFEAGALSKGLTKSRVCPLLVNLTPADLKAPLSQFNATMPMKEDMLKLVKTINSQKGEQALTDDRLQKAFDRWWSDFETKFAETLKTHNPTKAVTRRAPEDMIAEILEIVRSLQSSSQKSNPLVTTFTVPKSSSSALEHWLEVQAAQSPASTGSALEAALKSIQKDELRKNLSEIMLEALSEKKKKASSENLSDIKIQGVKPQEDPKKQ